MKSVAVLMATYNGEKFITAQVHSILNQTGVSVRIFVSDDLSTDNSWAILTELAKADRRVHLQPRKNKFGSATRNFLACRLPLISVVSITWLTQTKMIFGTQIN